MLKVTQGQQDNIGEKSTVTLYSCTDRHGGRHPKTITRSCCISPDPITVNVLNLCWVEF